MKLLIKFLMDILFQVGLLPLKLLPLKYKNLYLGKKIFLKRQLVRQNSDVVAVSPMPSKDELQKYYSSNYWGWRGQAALLSNRDLEQFKLLQTFSNAESGTFLNFGAGPGGASYLFWANNFQVTNIEPGGIKTSIDSRWRTLDDKENFTDSVDLLLSSHSLEHVNDLEATIKWMFDSLKVNGVIFIEVPNSVLIENGGMGQKLIVPHTYYFTKKFFTTLPFDVLHLETYRELGNGFHEEVLDDSGEVIRFIGKKL